MSRPAIFVDADACPVKDEAIKVAERHEMVMHLQDRGLVGGVCAVLL